jgi:hypothetical protein
MPHVRTNTVVAPPAPPQFERLTIQRPVVTPAGLVGNGVANESAAIMAAVAANPQGARFYFPAGMYKVHTAEGPPTQGVWIDNYSSFEFFGDGHATVFRWDTAQPGTGMMTFGACTNMLFHDLTFDSAGSPSFCGMRFYSCRRIEIRDCVFADSTSANDQAEGMDRYGLVFGHGGQTHQDIRVTGCFFDRVQCEFNHLQRAVISGNRSYRGWQTCGIGIFTNGTAAVAEDVLIENNSVIDAQPPGSAICVHMDPPQDDQAIMRRIWIKNNNILMKDATLSFAGAVPGGGISIGQPFLSADSEGCIWEDIAFVGNKMRKLTGLGEAFISILCNANFFTLYRFHIKDNVIRTAGPPTDIRYLREATVSGNRSILDSGHPGWVLTGAQEMELKDNHVIAGDPGAAYYFVQDVVGWNTYGPNNTGTGGSAPHAPTHNYTWGNNTPAVTDVFV